MNRTPETAPPDLLDRLRDGIRLAGVPRYRQPAVELLLGSDREIGRESRSLEKRVGITPLQARRLREFGDELGFRLDVLVVRGAGERSGYPDADYIAAGAEIVERDELPHLDGPPAVVHALKEPSPYERSIPGPFCRIGALHTGDFAAESGLAGLLLANRAAIFDGAGIGASGAYRIPIRGRMSELAGEIAADWIGGHLDRRGLAGRVVVVGAGYAGCSAVRRLAGRHGAGAREIHLFDDADRPDRLAALAAAFAPLGAVAVGGTRGLDHPDLAAALEGAVAVLFAVARPGHGAPKVVHVNTLKERPREGALIVDISIDEGGAVMDPAIRRTWSSKEIIPHLSAILHQAGLEYRATSNMPRAYPKRGSEAHGGVILPYLATLLFLAAREGGAEGVVDHLRTLDRRRDNPDPAQVEPAEVLAALTQDLRNGLAFYPRRGRVVVEDIVADRHKILDFLYRRDVPFEFQVGGGDGGGDSAADRTREAQVFPEPIEEALGCAVQRGVECRLISHPDQDGTTTGGAERALGVDAARILKCLVLKDAGGGYLGAICEGTQWLSFAKIRQLLATPSVQLASRDEVWEQTGHSVGGVPVVQIFDLVARVLVDRGVMDHDRVYGSAGTEYMGMEIAPGVLAALGGEVADITESRLHRYGGEIRKAVEELTRALDQDDDPAAGRAVAHLARIFR